VSNTEQDPINRRLTAWKKVLLAFLPVATIILVAELSLRAIGYQSPARDPYESFVLHRPLFLPEAGQLRTNPARVLYFHPQRFAPDKPAGAMRFFAMGGSTTYGDSLDDPLGNNYVSLLARELGRNFPGRKIEAINCGGISYASYRLLGIVEECVNYEPDFIILMTGNNEFLEPRFYAEYLSKSGVAERLLRVSRLVQWVANLRPRSKTAPQRGEAKMAVAADYVKVEYIVRSEDEIRLTEKHFAHNLRSIAATCRDHGIPLIICTVPSNVRDWPPFVSEANPAQPSEDLESRLERAKNDFSNRRYAEALDICQLGLADHPRAAVLHFLSAKSLEQLGRIDEAKAGYHLAKDTDLFPHRALTSFNTEIRQLATADGVELFDAEALFNANATNGIPGSELFLDNCHPNEKGHNLIAQGLKSVILDRLEE